MLLHECLARHGYLVWRISESVSWEILKDCGVFASSSAYCELIFFGLFYRSDRLYSVSVRILPKCHLSPRLSKVDNTTEWNYRKKDAPNHIRTLTALRNPSVGFRETATADKDLPPARKLSVNWWQTRAVAEPLPIETSHKTTN